MKAALKIFFILFFSLQIKAQLLFYQDTYHGGVTSDGVSYYNFDFLQPDTIDFQLHIPAGATIKKSFLISLRYPLLSGYFPPDNSLTVNLNNTNIVFDSSLIITQKYFCYSPFSGNWAMTAKDVTALVQNNNNKLITPNQVALMTADPKRNWVYASWVLIIMYEKNNLSTVSSTIYLNDNNIIPNETQEFHNLNPINTANNVGLSIMSAGVASFPSPFTPLSYTLNSSAGNFNLGSLNQFAIINGNNAWKKTLPGSFFYENNTLNGLVDDTPDAFIDSTDALADIKIYIPNGTTTFSLTSSGNQGANCVDLRQAYFLAYTTPCPARGNKDTTLVYNLCGSGTVTLNANNPSAGSYTWSAANNSLNNYSVASPQASPTVTTNYIALIDSAGCRHTEHFKVNVHNVPVIDSIKTSPNYCGYNINGAATVYAHSGTHPYLYSAGGASQSGNYFNPLPSNTYTAMLTDNAGCTAAQPFTINTLTLAVAGFTYAPQIICTNEPVQFTNTSQNTNNQIWHFTPTDSSAQQSPVHVFNDTGKYVVTLNAYQSTRNCNSIYTQTLTVKECPPDSFSITVPNVFSPNADGINDAWSVNIYNRRYTVNEFSVTVYDRWGVKVFSTSLELTAWDGHTTAGLECSEGTYFYTLSYKASSSGEVVKEEKLKGFVTLVK